jgi:hypothetical protein
LCDGVPRTRYHTHQDALNKALHEQVEELIMLSPHELATLMLVHSAPDQIDMTRVEVDTLLDCQLIALEPRVGGWRRAKVTPAGVHVLEATARVGKNGYGDAVTREDDNLM